MNAQADQFKKGSLDRQDVSSDPLEQFHKWFRQAQEAKVANPETVCLSTASLPSGRITSRFVYLKELDKRGFVIYSNWGTSQKAKDIASNPRASLAFLWKDLERQVCIEGSVERLSTEESQVYFDTRVRGSRIGAHASRQSLKIESRETLENWVKETEKKFEGVDKIPCPDFWGGIRIVPDRIQFWQGRMSRLHDRFEFVREKEGEPWEISRLSP